MTGPGLPTAPLSDAVALHREGRLAEARRLYEDILAGDARHFDALHMLGVLTVQSGDPGGALAWLDRAIAVRPGNALAHFNRGTALQELDLLQDALDSFARALAIRPMYPEAHFNVGVVLAALVRWEEALASFDRAVACNPAYAAAHVGRCDVLRKLRRLDAALASSAQAIAIAPGLAEAHVHRALVLREMNQREAAIASCDRALALESRFAQAWCDRGNMLYELHRLDEAIMSFDRATAIDPNLVGAHSSRAMALLLAGRMEEGWPAYDWRLQARRGGVLRERTVWPQPRWTGEQSLQGRSILLHAEQGFGDTLQFCRYVPRVAALGAKVVLQVPGPLVRLLGSLRGVGEIVSQDTSPPSCDLHCELPGLPRAFRTALATIPQDVPYLAAELPLQRRWQDRLGSHTVPRVGLVWSGGFRPQQPELWGVNSRRNLPLAQLAGIAVAGIDFYSLQKGEAAEAELTAFAASGAPPVIRDCSTGLQDFADTAALIAELDLVISVDTSTAHLAGALGRPVWLLNRFDTCWRWLLDRDDSPWYPTLRLYRQREPGDWQPVVQRVGADLRAWLAAWSQP